MKRLLAILLIVGCVSQGMSLTITSPAFTEGMPIPSKYSCDSEDINPQIDISDIPLETESFALIMYDPDASGGNWVHWVMWNIPVTQRIEEGSAPGVQGENSWGWNNYGGPCPPSGTHRYVFKVYALDTVLKLHNSTDRVELERQIQGHILAEGQLMGVYTRE